MPDTDSFRAVKSRFIGWLLVTVSGLLITGATYLTAASNNHETRLTVLEKSEAKQDEINRRIDEKLDKIFDKLSK